MAMAMMTKAERDELGKILKGRARVAKQVVEQRAAELKADVEAKLAATFKAYDPKWKDLTQEAERAVRDVDAEIAAKCRMLGIPEAFRPGISLNWYSRGENAMNSRRVELRRVAQARIDALAKASAGHDRDSSSEWSRVAGPWRPSVGRGPRIPGVDAHRGVADADA